VLAEALRAAGQSDEAATMERAVRERGAGDDPRTLALFLATQRESPALALHLAEDELENRADVFTYDALAWARHAAGQDQEALAAIDQALSEGTQDGRLFLHAAIIANARHENGPGR